MTWDLTDHACGRCFGRVLEREDGNVWRYRCAECGKEGQGTALSMCACSTKVGGHPGLVCLRNPQLSEALPQEVVVRQRADAKKERDGRVPARVEVGGGRVSID